MKVGDKVWLFDENRRVYPKNEGICGGPIYEKHFYQVTIESETSRSWIINRQKFSKKDPRGIYTDNQKDDKIWDNDNRYKIVDIVRRCSTEDLKRIFKILIK